MSSISIIIPTYNESESICRLLDHLIQTKSDSTQILVADGGSEDGTCACCEKYSEVQLVRCNAKGRASQMNQAAKLASSDILYFVHADTIPTKTWESDIKKAISKGHELGGFRFKFDSNKPLLCFNSWATRFNILSFRGGDQSIFISNTLFKLVNGYSDMEIMEEYDLIKKCRAEGISYHLIQKDTLVSARKYEKNSYLKVNFENFLAMLKFRLGVDHSKIKKRYSEKILK